MEGIRVLEERRKHSSVQGHLARRTSLFLCHILDEPDQCHNISYCSEDRSRYKFNVRNFFPFIKRFEFALTNERSLRPTLILEVILSCRLLLNLRGAQASTIPQPHLDVGQPKWSDTSKTLRTSPSQNSVSKLEEAVLHSTQLPVFEGKLEPNRRVVKEPTAFDLLRVESSWSNV